MTLTTGNGLRAGARRWSRVLVVLLGLVAAATVVPQSPAAAAGFRNFDAVTTVSQNGTWKHMALIGTEYAIYTDAGLIEGPTRIAFKWPFLPEEFTHDIDSAAVYFSGPGFRWQHRWTKGNRIITFEDSGIVREQTLPVGKYDAYASFNYNGKYCCVFTMGTYGDKYVAWAEQFPGQPIFGTEYPLAFRFPYIPVHFTYDLDDISIENNGNTYSFYKGNERILFDTQRVFEVVNLDRKWPFLNAWRQM